MAVVGGALLRFAVTKRSPVSSGAGVGVAIGANTKGVVRLISAATVGPLLVVAPSKYFSAFELIPGKRTELGSPAAKVEGKNVDVVTHVN